VNSALHAHRRLELIVAARQKVFQLRRQHHVRSLGRHRIGTTA
jgi:hypothetical protein